MIAIDRELPRFIVLTGTRRTRLGYRTDPRLSGDVGEVSLTSGDGACAWNRASGALMPPIAQSPAVGMGARRAGEPARPAQPLQVVQALRIGAKPGLELAR
jgi:hypothetical protein